MNPTLLPKTERASWREMLATPDSAHAALALALTLFSALAFALCDHFFLAALYLLACLLFLYHLTRSLVAMLFYVIPAFLLYGIAPFLPGVTEPLLLPTAFCALIIGGSCGGFLFLHYHNPRKHWYIYTLPLVAYAASSLLASDPWRGLLALLPLLLAAVFAVCLSLCLPHTESVLTGIVTLVLSLTVAGLITAALFGSLNGNSLALLADSMRATVEAFFREASVLYAEMGLDLGLTDVYIANVAALFVNISPALFFIAASVVSYLAWRTLLCLLVAFRTLPRLPRRIAAFSVSATGAAIFIVSYIISLFANSESATLFGTIAENLALVLEPALALIGFHALFSGKGARSCMSYILAIGLVFVLVSNPLTGLALAAFFGAFNILAARFFPPTDEKGEQ